MKLKALLHQVAFPYSLHCLVKHLFQESPGYSKEFKHMYMTFLKWKEGVLRVNDAFLRNCRGVWMKLNFATEFDLAGYP